jgi:hypothetical protein
MNPTHPVNPLGTSKATFSKPTVQKLFCLFPPHINENSNNTAVNHPKKV